MKTRWISLLLCLVMLLSVALTGCSEQTRAEAEEEVSEEASQSALTLTMWVVAEEKPSTDAYNRISNLINSITKSKFKIQLILRYFTEAEYRTELEKAITAFEANKQNIEVTEPDEDEKETVSEEYVTNQQGLSVIKYPEVLQNQVDIIYIAGEDMYFDYINEGRLASLNDQLASTAKKIKEYVSPTLLSAAQVNGVTYAIPNNRPIGEYTFMLLNKSLMKEYAQDAYVKLGMIDGLFSENLYQFLDLVALKENVVPINYTYEDCLNLLAHYWNVSSKDYSVLQEFSAFGHYYDSIEDLSRGSIILGYESLFENENFVKDYLKLNEFRFKGYIQEGDVAEGTETAVKFMTGDSTILDPSKVDDEGIICYKDADGTEYYPVVVGYPTATSADIYDNMFGVYSYSRNVSRSMEIVTYLNTNADFRNLLQYGEEGVDYEVIKDEEGNFQRIRDLGTGYQMSIWATGNTFIAYPDTTAGLPVRIWENGKKQNQDSLVYPLLGFNFKDNAAPDFVEVEELPAEGYDISIRSGLDKDLLKQNAEIAKWLNAADAAKGIYVLKSTNVGDSFTTINYYFYNNDVSGKTVVSAKVEDVMEENDKGKEVLVGMNFIVDFATAAGTSATPGYELSCVTVRALSSVADMATLKVTKGGTEVSANVKSVAGFISFDLCHTQNYDVEIYDDLSWVEVRKNLALDSWLNTNKPNSTQKASKTYSLFYKDGNTYTFAIYRNKLSKKNTLTVDVNGNANKVTVTIKVDEDPKEALEEESADYLLCYVTIKAASADVQVNCKYMFNGKIGVLDGETEDVNPNFERLGTMDTEIVKFIERLNVVLVDALDACYRDGMAAVEAGTMTVEEAFAAYKALVNDISKLMDTTVDVKKFENYNVENYPALAARVPDFFAAIGVKDKEVFIENIQSAVSSTIIKKPDVVGAGGTKYPATYESSGEEYVYFDSPYGIYYKWLKDYKYLPKEK